jgi:CHAT domain-containing protein
VFPVYEQAVTAAFLLFEKTGKSSYAEQAFLLSEQSKAAVLAESVRGLQISKQKGVPADLLQQERELRRKIARLTVSSLEARDSAQTVALRDQIRDGEIALSQLVRKLNAHEKYARLKYASEPVALAHLQKQVLDGKTTLVEYFCGEKDWYAFVVTADAFRVFRLSADTIFKNALSQYNALLYGHHSSPQQPVWANMLYQKLIAPLNIRTEKLLLIPDGELNYLPFEALIGNLNKQEYLLHEYRVRYAYSATLLDFFRQQKRGESNGEMLAMAPFAGQSGELFRNLNINPLPASRQEVEQTGGRIYLESAATKDVFLKTASRYGIIHLATHAQADSEEPLNSYIAFHPQHPDSLSGYRLYTSELYNLELDSVKLVVLSACETGGGQLVRGEGVMSLARGFAYAGCPNIVMTLWRAEDQATAWLTTRLHHYLRKGYDKDEALYQAKKDYLAEAPSARRQPYYWANLVLVGDDVPVYASQQWYWIWWILVLVVLVGGVLIWRKWKGVEKRMTVSG